MTRDNSAGGLEQLAGAPSLTRRVMTAALNVADVAALAALPATILYVKSIAGLTEDGVLTERGVTAAGIGELALAYLGGRFLYWFFTAGKDARIREGIRQQRARDVELAMCRAAGTEPYSSWYDRFIDWIC